MKKTYLGLVALSLLFTTGVASCGSTNSGTSASESVAAVKSLEIVKNPTKTAYIEGQKFSKTGMELKATLEDGTTLTPKNSEVTISPATALKTTDTKVTASYKEASVDIPITVSAKVLDSILITAPTVTTVGTNDVYGFDGLVVMAHYNDNSEDVEVSSDKYSLSIDGTTIKATDLCSLAAGDYNVTVTYETKTATFAITVITKTIKTVTFTDPSSTTLAKGGNYDFSGFKATATFEEEGLTSAELNINRIEFSINDTVVHEGDAIALDKGTYTVNVKVLGTTTEFTHEFTIKIMVGYKIEAEGLTDADDDSITASTYVKGKKSKDDTSYISYHTETGMPLASLSDSSTASGGGYLGEVYPSSYIEFHFKSEIVQNASIEISAASCWLREDSNWQPLWMGDIQLNQVFSATANDTAVTIEDSVVLPGSGSKGNTTTGIASWWGWQTVSFGEMSLKAGWNVIAMEIKPEFALATYVNSHGSYTIMNLDFVQVSFD
ncbi:MAG: bacterial Ig-like domain-containing protein [Bacilli bacterium]|jgi:hypothetical protein